MEKRTLGQILLDMGRIDEEQVQKALAHQREHGGFFGEALVACGFVNREELEFGLASQFDLPYVFPDAAAVDLEAASIVTPEWALAHLTMPIMATESSLTVVVESPLATEPVDMLRGRTDLEIELALASGPAIRELIREVYARAAAVDEEQRAPADLADALDEIIGCGSLRFGLSIRRSRSVVWWDDHGTIRRQPLGGDWLGTLDRFMTPSPVVAVGDRTRAAWDAKIDRGGVVTDLAIRYLSDESGSEYLCTVRPDDSERAERFAPPPEGVLSEVRMLARSGRARFIVTSDPEEVGAAILPHLPEILLDPTWRSVYLNAQHGPAADEAFSVMLPEDSEAWGVELEALRAFHFDVVTVDLTGGHRNWTEQTLNIGSVAFLLWPGDESTTEAREAGIRWRLHLTGAEEELEWVLEPLEE